MSSPESDATNRGCLLLWLEGGVVYSLNPMATIVWQQLETNANGLQLSQIVADIGEQCHIPTNDPFYKVVERDVRELLEWFEYRGVVEKKERSNTTYRIIGSVFRAENEPLNSNHLQETKTSRTSESDVVRAIRQILTPSGNDRELGVSVLDQVAEINRHHSSFHTWTALLLFLAYDLALKIFGFRRLFQIVARQKTKGRQTTVALIQQVCAGIERARIWYPKQIMCMQHSVVVKCLFQHYGVPAKIVIAARKMPFKCHAWVEIEGRVVNDTQKVRTFYTAFKRY